jgi:hypothetical protein
MSSLQHGKNYKVSLDWGDLHFYATIIGFASGNWLDENDRIAVMKAMPNQKIVDSTGRIVSLEYCGVFSRSMEDSVVDFPGERLGGNLCLLKKGAENKKIIEYEDVEEFIDHITVEQA